MNEVRIIPIQGIPEIKVDDNLAEITFDVLSKSEIGIEKNDIFVVTQKIVSKSEGMERDLLNYDFEELLYSESKKIIRKRGDLVIAKTHHGFICANAGIDKSNVKKNSALLLPEDPNKSAYKFQKRFESLARGNFFLNLDFNELNTATVSSGMLFVSVESKNQKVIRKCIVLKN